MDLEAPYDYDPMFGALDRFCDGYEWFLVGGIDTPPVIDDVPEEQRPTAQAYTEYLEWKYAEGLWEARNRHAGSPEHLRSMFKVIQGGSAGED